jgi:hypothetical protein
VRAARGVGKRRLPRGPAHAICNTKVDSLPSHSRGAPMAPPRAQTGHRASSDDHAGAPTTTTAPPPPLRRSQHTPPTHTSENGDRMIFTEAVQGNGTGPRPDRSGPQEKQQATRRTLTCAAPHRRLAARRPTRPPSSAARARGFEIRRSGLKSGDPVSLPDIFPDNQPRGGRQRHHGSHPPPTPPHTTEEAVVDVAVRVRGHTLHPHAPRRRLSSASPHVCGVTPSTHTTAPRRRLSSASPRVCGVTPHPHRDRMEAERGGRVRRGVRRRRGRRGRRGSRGGQGGRGGPGAADGAVGAVGADGRSGWMG